tara:strand:- start:538 stop:1074 length:537 start_codon:yes stop_codon:yes gene_type:complete
MINNLKLIVCCDANYGIGYMNNLPWKIAEEMKLFQSKTIGERKNCVIMGKHTFNSIPPKYSPLKNRHNCVLSSQTEAHDSESISIFASIDTLLEWIKEKEYSYDTFWVIGGKQVYDLVVRDARINVDEIHMSILDTIYECDTFFDVNCLEQYEVSKSTRFECSKFTHRVYVRKTLDCP